MAGSEKGSLGLNIQERVNESLASLHHDLLRRPRYRKMAEIAVKLDRMQGEQALIASNREAAIAENEERSRREAEERRRQREEEYNRPENVEKRRQEREARYQKHYDQRKAYAAEIRSNSSFDLNAWLKHHDAKPDLVTVEIGHAARPIAQYHHYQDGRAYIGVEAHINTEYGGGGETQEAIDQIKTERPNENIFFLDVNTRFDEVLHLIRRDDPRYTGRGQSYDPSSLLPEGAADVVVMVHTLDDHRIKYIGDNQELLLAEAARITAPDGKIVISEYDNRWYGLSEDSLDGAGLQVDQIIFWQDDPEEFQQMQERFHIFETPGIVPGRTIFGLNLGLDSHTPDRYRFSDGELRPPEDAFYMILSRREAQSV